MLVTIGDLVEDIVVTTASPFNYGSDTPATITRRPGGSAANVAVAAVEAGGRARFVGQVGDDAAGASLVASLRTAGVDTSILQQGRTGTIVVVVDEHGERTMFPDRGSCADLAELDPSWLRSGTALHVPLYSLVSGPLATTGAALIELAHDVEISVSIDLSSAGVIEEFGVEETVDLLRTVRPEIVFANADETRIMGGGSGVAALASVIAVCKNGPQPVELHEPAGAVRSVRVLPIDAADTTGAGDAFAAGFLVAATAGQDLAASAIAGNRAAARRLNRQVMSQVR